MSASWIQSLFEDKAIVDHREPFATFQIPNVEGTFGVFAPEIKPWQQLLTVSSLLHLNVEMSCHSYPCSLSTASHA